MSRLISDPRSGEPLRVMLVVPTLASGGTEGQIATLCPRLRGRGVQPVVFALKGGGLLAGRLRKAGIEVITPRPCPRPLKLFLCAFHLWAQLLKRRIAVVHFFLPEAYLVGGVASLAVPGLRRVMSRRSLNHYQQNHPLKMQIHSGWYQP